MSKEIIINVDKGQTRIALIEEGELAELYIESAENERTLGDIYLGRVRRTMPSIQAAFIDIGQKQDAFLHYSDLADNLPEWLKLLESDKPQVSRFVSMSKTAEAASIRKPPANTREKEASAGPSQKAGEEDAEEKNARSSGSRGKSRNARRGSGRPPGKNNGRKSGDDEFDGKPARSTGGPPPETFLDKGKPILVKIVKEPISAKGSRVSTDISLAGRFLVLVPLANYVAVSKKIYSFKERRRLRALARSLLPEGFGVIVRTVAEGKKAKELDTDLRLLLDKWRKIEKKLEGSPTPPTVVHVDANMASSVIRDLFSDDYDRILIDDAKLHRNVKNYVQAVAPHMVPAVQLHSGKRPVFKEAKIAHEVAQAFESRVDLPSGGYLFIEHTEAMHVVDVNSGRAGRGLSQEENSLKVDIEAVHAIAKQIRLRDLGGIIVIDFIDLREERNRKKVFFELRKAFRRDRAVTKILPMSDFGLVEITRQRLRPSITKTFSSPGVSTKTGGVEKAVVKKERRARTTTVEGFIEKIERWITSYKKKGKGRVLHLQVHPFAASFLNQKIPGYPLRWFVKYFIRVRLKIDETLDPLGFRFVDPESGEDLTRPDQRGERSRRNNRRKSALPEGAPKTNEGSETEKEAPSSERGPGQARRRPAPGKSGERRSQRGGRSRGRGGKSNRPTSRSNRPDADQNKPESNAKPPSGRSRDEKTRREPREQPKRESRSEQTRREPREQPKRESRPEQPGQGKPENNQPPKQEGRREKSPKEQSESPQSQGQGRSRGGGQRSNAQRRNQRRSPRRGPRKPSDAGDAGQASDPRKDEGPSDAS